MSKQEKQIKWTAAQQRAIETVGRTVLVAASAGTGKTAALSGRAVGRIADPGDATQADSLLVLTFTDAAAEEMRSRIAETLYKESRRARDGRLTRQLLLLDRANISTIHAFCKRMLTEFFYLAGLDAAFGILDADEQKLLKSEVLDETLEAAWADEAFAPKLTAIFNGRRVQAGTRSFIDRVIPLAGFLDSVAGREEFYTRAAEMNDVTQAAYEKLRGAQKRILLEQLAQCEARLEQAMALDRQHCNGQYAADYIQGCVLPVVEECQILLEQNRFDLCREHLAGLDFGRMPGFKTKLWPAECKDLITEPIKHVRDKLKGLSDFALLSAGYNERIGAPAAEQTRTLLELLARFDRTYAEAKRRRNVLDFADLEHRMLGLLKNKPEVAADLRGRFEYIFVDEYQDINAVQQSILEYLRREDNLFVVGDVKQSIYGFRQSKPEIFLRQLGAAAEADVASKAPCRIDLKENFRCRGEIIDFVNAVFGRVMTAGVADMDYDARAQLVSGFNYPPFAAEGGPAEPVELVLLDEEATQADEEAESGETDEQEAAMSVSPSQRQAAWIAQRIRRLVGAQTGTPEIWIYDKKTETTKPVEYRDIVILMRSLSHKAREYVEILRLAGVPVSSQSSCGYFEAAEISDCLCLLKVLDNPDRDIELAGLLRSPLFSFSDDELVEIRLHGEGNSKSETQNPKQIQNTNSKGSKQGCRLEAGGTTKDAGCEVSGIEKMPSGSRRYRASFYEAVRGYERDGADEALREKVGAALGEIRAWRSAAQSGSLADLLDGVLREKGLLSFYAALPNGAQRRANLLKLHDHAIQFEHFRTTDPGAALGRFVEFLEKMADEGQDWAPAEPDSAGENAVRLMSVHKSKGLEFGVVFVAELNTRFNMQDAAGECLISEEMVGLQIPQRRAGRRYPSMAHQVIAASTRKANLAEEMRILYVALTRAREKLILTGSRREQSCVNDLRRCAALEGNPPDWMLGEGNCHLDWLLTGLGNCRSLHAVYGTGAERNLVQGTRFFVERVGREQLEETARRILRDKRSLKSVTEPPAGSAMSQAKVTYEHIRHNLKWQYAYENAVTTNAKFSVSELVRHEGMSDTAFGLRPAAVMDAAVEKADALAVGSAFHALFEALDLGQSIDRNAIEQTARRLVDSATIKEAEARAIDVEAVLSFFDCELGQLTLAHGTKVLREWPFTYALDGQAAGLSLDDEAVILQGIADLIIPSEKGLVVVDFKTDRVKENALERHSERYAGQLGYYARAAAAILRQPAAGVWLYYLTPRKAYEIKL